MRGQPGNGLHDAADRRLLTPSSCFRGSHDEHRAVRVAQDALGYRSENEPIDAPFAVRTDDDQVGVYFLRECKDALLRIAEVDGDRERGASDLVSLLPEPRAALLDEALQRL